MLIGAWIAMLLASNLSVILWRGVLRSDVPGWDLPIRVIVLVILFSLTLAWSELRPVQGYVLALIALAIGNWMGELVRHTEVWMTWARTAPEYLQVLADALLKVLPAGLMALTLVGSGIGFRGLFLLKGTLNARSTLPWLESARWTWVAPIGILAFAVPLALQLTLTIRPNFQLLKAGATALPLALLFAIVNAASEEFRFRSVLLARLVPALGRTHALWLTSIQFGLGHWFGHPSGITGALMASAAGFILATSMLDTGGFFWAFTMHGIQDVVIFVFLVMAKF